MQPKKVLKISDAWQWFAEAEQLVLNSRALIGHGWEVHVACQPESPLWQRCAQIGAQLHPLPGMRGPNPLSRPANIWRIYKLIDRLRPDLLHAYRSTPHALSALALGLSEHQPPLVRSRGAAQKIKRHPLNRWLYHSADAIIASSTRVARDLRAFGVDAAKIQVLRGAVDPQALHRGSAKNFVRQFKIDDRPRVGILGRIAEVKGHRYAIDALDLLRRRGVRAQLLCAGDPRPRVQHKLERQIAGLAVQDQVRFLGRVDNVADFLASLDVLLIASIGSETISRALLEGMAAGCAIVATEVGVIPEILNKNNGLLIAPQNRQAIAQALELLLKQPQKRQQLGQAARQKIQRHYLLQQHAQKLASIYHLVWRGDGRTT